MTQLRRLHSLLVCLLIISFSLLAYHYWDRPIAGFFARLHTRRMVWLAWVANWPVRVVYGAVLLFYVTSAFRLFFKHNIRFYQRHAWMAHAVLLTIFLKNMLKLIAGRAWPATFFCHNPSYLTDGVYGFHFFQFDGLLASFPSGHAAVITVVACLMLSLKGCYQYLGAIVMGAVLLAQVVLYYHYLSDVLIGAALGAGVAAFMSRVERRTFSIPI